MKIAQSRFARNIRWQLVANGMQALLGGIYLIVLGRLLGVEQFGIFSTIAAAVAVVGLCLELRLQEVIARDFCLIDGAKSETPLEAGHVVDLFVLECMTRLIPMAFLLILSSFVLSQLNLSSATWDALLVCALAFILGKSGNSVSTGLLRVLGRTDLIAACSIADWSLRLLLTVMLGVLSYLNVTTAVWVTLLAGGLCNGILVVLACSVFTRRVQPIPWSLWSLKQAMQRLRGSLRLITSNLGISLSDLMAKDLDIVLLASMLNPVMVGLYKMAKSFVQVIWRAIDPFYLTIMPEIQRLWQLKQFSALWLLLRKTSSRLLALSVTLVAMAYGLLIWLSPLLLSVEYAGVPRLMLTMSFWVVVCSPLIWGIPLAIAINRPELSAIGSFLGLVVGLVAFSVLTPTLGLTGAALAWNITLISGVAFIAIFALVIATRMVNGKQSISA